MAEVYQHVEQEEEDEANEDDSLAQFPFKKQNNTLPLYGNKESMNINSMILTNIVQSPYFKQDLYLLKTFHEVVDEIYYRVEHLEPWEKNSRKLAGQVGMCAGVRGVAAGGIVSTPFCLLYKLFTLKLTRKQVNVMLNHTDSPHIRGLGFLYIRYCQPPKDFWDWFYPFLEDEEEIELRAGGGLCVTVGEMCRMMLSRQDWFGTMFPRLPVNVQKTLEEKLKDIKKPTRIEGQSKDEEVEVDVRHSQSERSMDRSRDSQRGSYARSGDRKRDDSQERKRDREKDSRRRSRSRERSRDYGRRHGGNSYDRDRRHRSRSHSRERKRYRSRSPERRRRYRSRS